METEVSFKAGRRIERQTFNPIFLRFRNVRTIVDIFAVSSSIADVGSERLRESEARLSLAAASANAGLWTLDPDTGQIWATDKLYELFKDPNWKVRQVAAQLVLKMSDTPQLPEFFSKLGQAENMAITEPLRYGALLATM